MYAYGILDSSHAAGLSRLCEKSKLFSEIAPYLFRIMLREPLFSGKVAIFSATNEFSHGLCPGIEIVSAGNGKASISLYPIPSRETKTE